VRGLGVIRRSILERLESAAKPDGRIGEHVLDTALALNTLRNLEFDSAIVEPALTYLLKLQGAAGGWAALPFLSRRGGALQWGSKELTTAFCLRVLARYREG
jgi:hypothetical protein